MCLTLTMETDGILVLSESDSDSESAMMASELQPESTTSGNTSTVPANLDHVQAPK